MESIDLHSLRLFYLINIFDKDHVNHKHIEK